MDPNVMIEMMIVNAIQRAGRSMATAMPTRQTPDELLAVKDVAKILKLGINYTSQLVQTGVIPSIQLNGRKVRRRALEAWMASMEGMDLKDPAHPVPIERENIA